MKLNYFINNKYFKLIIVQTVISNSRVTSLSHMTSRKSVRLMERLTSEDYHFEKSPSSRYWSYHEMPISSGNPRFSAIILDLRSFHVVQRIQVYTGSQKLIFLNVLISEKRREFTYHTKFQAFVIKVNPRSNAAAL